MKDPDHDHPRFGWLNPEVEALFKAPNPSASPSPGPGPSPSPTPGSGPPGAKPPSKDRTGAIAGGVVGGLIAILVVAVVWYRYFRSTPDDPKMRPELPAHGVIVQELPVGDVMVQEAPGGSMVVPGYVEMYQPNMQANPYNVYRA